MGAEIRSSMETVCLGTTAEGFRVFMDRNAWEADGVVVMNRIKPHTDFCGRIESGLLKILAVGMGKIDGATEVHIRARRYGLETVIRSISGKMLATGKILCGLGVVENELHQICAVRAARPENIAAQEEAILEMARTLVARIPFSKFQLLIVDQLGKNISGAGMDTKVIGRGVELRPGEAPAIEVIYVRDLTPETAGNAAGVGLADLIHERLYRKIDMEKTNINLRTSLNLPLTGVPIYLPSDRAALDLALGYLGSPEPPEQRIVWIRNTQSLNRIAISEPLAGEAAEIRGWRMAPDTYDSPFDSEGDLPSPV